MSLTGRQHGLYGRLFERVLAVQPEADRLAMHAELGLPASRRDWHNRHFDEWIRTCLAITHPADLAAQLHGLNGEAARRVFVIRELLEDLDAPEAYALGIVQAMKLAGPAVPLEALEPEALEAVIVALRKQRGRRRREPVAAGEGDRPF